MNNAVTFLIIVVILGCTQPTVEKEKTIDLELHSYFCVCNKDDRENLDTKLQVHSDFHDKMNTFNSSLEPGKCLKDSIKLSAITHCMITINGQTKFVHMRPSQELKVDYLDGLLNIKDMGKGYSKYVADLNKNWLNDSYLAQFNGDIDDEIYQFEKNFILYNELELKLRKSDVSNRKILIDSLFNSVPFNNSVLAKNQMYLYFLSSFFFASYDLEMEKNIPGYTALSYYEKEIARKKFYTNHYAKNSNITLSVEKYLEDRKVEYWTYNLRKGKETLTKEIFDLFAFHVAIATIKVNKKNFKYQKSYIEENLGNEELLNTIRKTSGELNLGFSK